jgi:hypothetical protein
MTDEELQSYLTKERATLVPCLHCNTIHLGAWLDHAHQSVEGVGYVRLIVCGGAEFCWRCSCRKSGHTNIANDVTDHCADVGCICHTAARAA